MAAGVAHARNGQATAILAASAAHKRRAKSGTGFVASGGLTPEDPRRAARRQIAHVLGVSCVPSFLSLQKRLNWWKRLDVLLKWWHL